MLNWVLLKTTGKDRRIGQRKRMERMATWIRVEKCTYLSSIPCMLVIENEYIDDKCCQELNYENLVFGYFDLFPFIKMIYHLNKTIHTPKVALRKPVLTPMDFSP